MILLLELHTNLFHLERKTEKKIELKEWFNIVNKIGSLMGNDIRTGLSLRAVCFDFRSTNVGSSVIRTRSTTGFDVITL